MNENNNKLTYIVVIIILVLLGVGGYFLYARGKAEKNEYNKPNEQDKSYEQNENNDAKSGGNENYINEQNNEEQNNNETDQNQTQTKAKEITVIGSEFKFEPNLITVNKGDEVKITFKNIGNAPHNLAIPELNIETKTIRKGETDIIEFTAPASKTYEFICSVPGHKERGMEGELEIR